MIEYTNGQFGCIAPAKQIIEDLLAKFPNLDEVRAVHFGTPNELSDIRQNKLNVNDIHERISELEREVKSLHPTGMIKVYHPDDIPHQG